MPLARVGALPVAVVNAGLSASLPGLGAKSAKLTADLTGLQLALAGQVQGSLEGPPALPSLALAVAAQANPLELAAQFNPVNLGAVSIDAGAEIAVDLAFVTAQLAIAEGVAGTLNLGLSAGGVAGFSYAGPAAVMGSELQRYTASGFGKTAATAEVQAVIIATESLASWQAFSQSVNTGGTAAAAAPAVGRMAFLGELAPSSWNPGVASVAADIDLLVADLRGQQSGLEGSLSLLAGVGLPEVEVVIDTGVSVVAELGIDGLLDNLINVDADITGSIGGIQAELDALVTLTGGIAAQLEAGGLMFWTYTGSAAGLGEALAAELEQGIPGGTGPKASAYGLVIVGTPANMATFGSIFKTS